MFGRIGRGDWSGLRDGADFSRPDPPIFWTPFVGVQDINAATKKAEKLGAKIAQQIMETPWGLVSTILDPSGASLSLWQAKPKK